eukprot:3213815-Prymnesium_polylepis.2
MVQVDEALAIRIGRGCIEHNEMWAHEDDADARTRGTTRAMAARRHKAEMEAAARRRRERSGRREKRSAGGRERVEKRAERSVGL